MLRSLFKKPTIITCLITLCLLIYTLIFIPIGMANNGDYYRITSQNNLYFLEHESEDQFFGHFIKDFGVLQYYNEVPKQERIITSQNVFVKLAMILDRLFTGEDGIFDIRFLAAIYIVLYLIGFYLIIDYLTYQKSFLTSLIIGLASMFIFADTSYTAYFNSFYAEGLAYILILILFGSILLLSQHRYRPFILYSIIFICSALLTTLKQQYAPIGIILGLFFLILAIREHRYVFKKVLYISSGSIALFSILAYLLIPQEFVTVNQYHAMTRGILMSADNPEEALKEFNIRPEYSMLNEETAYVKYALADLSSEEVHEEFFSHYNFISISMYYMKHPEALGKMLAISSANAYSPRPTVLGNYLKSSGKPAGTQTRFFTLYNQIRAGLTPKSVGFLFIWCIIVILVNFKNTHQRIVIATLVLIGLSQIGISIIGAGDADLAKHTFLFTVIFDLINLIGIAHVISYISTKVSFKFTTKSLHKGGDRSANL